MSLLAGLAAATIVVGTLLALWAVALTAGRHRSPEDDNAQAETLKRQRHTTKRDP